MPVYHNSDEAKETKGELLGLEGNLALPVMAAWVFGLFLSLLLAASGVFWLFAGLIGLTPPAGITWFVFRLVNGQPPRFWRDWLDDRLGLARLSFNPRKRRKRLTDA